MVDLIPSPESVMEILKKPAPIVAVILFIRMASMHHIIFRCHWHFDTTTMLEFSPSG